MKKDDTQTLTPRLRFPEFRKGKGWEQRQAGELFTNRIEHGEDGLPIYSVTMDDGMVKRSSLDRKFDDIAESEGNKKVYKNDIAYNMMRMWQGAFGVAVEDCMVSPAYVVLTPQEGVSSDFFGKLLKTPCSLRSLTSQSHGLTKDRLRLYYKDFAQLPLPLPSLSEQQKIADCLTSVDELIAAQGRKVEALKAHKRGLMQQLFPREGETLPRLRFPEFRDAPEWESKRLDDLAKRGTGHTPNKASVEYYNGGIKWVSLADSKRLDKGLISETEIEVSQEGIDNSSAVLHPAGTVMVILSRDAGVGKSAITSVLMAVSQHFIVWICNSQQLSNWFLYFILQIQKPVFERVATGSTIKTIGMPFFKDMRVCVPSFAEQERIADCLSSLDARLAAEVEKLAALKTHKQGLMQQLFPSPEGS
jgi:type I restriction enzyme S subunit